MNDFVDQVAVITGASSGIGKAITLDLAAQGATLCLVGRRLEKLKAIAESARVPEDRVRSYYTDLAKIDDIHHFSNQVKQEFEHIHLLVHSAGTITLGSIENLPVEMLDRMYYVNVRAPYILTQALLPKLRASKGQIVFINSSAGRMKARANVGQYSATKHALKAITDCLRDEVNGDGIRVMSVFPGRTATTMQVEIHRSEGKHYNPKRLMSPDDIASVVVSALSLPRTAEVTDLTMRPFAKT